MAANAQYVTDQLQRCGVARLGYLTLADPYLVQFFYTTPGWLVVDNAIPQPYLIRTLLCSGPMLLVSKPKPASASGPFLAGSCAHPVHTTPTTLYVQYVRVLSLETLRCQFPSGSGLCL